MKKSDDLIDRDDENVLNVTFEFTLMYEFLQQNVENTIAQFTIDDDAFEASMGHYGMYDDTDTSRDKMESGGVGDSEFEVFENEEDVEAALPSLHAMPGTSGQASEVVEDGVDHDIKCCHKFTKIVNGKKINYYRLLS